MANFLNNNSTVQQRSQREILCSRYQSSRHNLLLVIIFSLINIVLLVANSGSYFLFSAFIPFMLVDDAMFYCGLYPAEFYEEFYPGMEFFGTSFMVACCVFAAVVLGLYFLSWILSKKPRVGWLIFALVLFVIDTVAMLLLVADLSKWIIDIVFHGFVIFSLARGIVAYFKVKKLPQDAEECGEEPQAQNMDENFKDSTTEEVSNVCDEASLQENVMSE